MADESEILDRVIATLEDRVKELETENVQLEKLLGPEDSEDALLQR